MTARTRMGLGEMATIQAAYHQPGCRTFKWPCLRHAQQHWRSGFPHPSGHHRFAGLPPRRARSWRAAAPLRKASPLSTPPPRAPARTAAPQGTGLLRASRAGASRQPAGSMPTGHKRLQAAPHRGWPGRNRFLLCHPRQRRWPQPRPQAGEAGAGQAVRRQGPHPQGIGKAPRRPRRPPGHPPEKEHETGGHGRTRQAPAAQAQHHRGHQRPTQEYFWPRTFTPPVADQLPPEPDGLPDRLFLLRTKNQPWTYATLVFCPCPQSLNRIEVT